MQLSKRLSLIASFIRADSSVCDVGCDHGYLSAFLAFRGDVKKITVTDINEKPLLNAKKTFQKYGISSINTVLCDGLQKVGRSDADTVVIAGMGGDVISGIIERAPFLKDGSVTLILQPMTSVFTLRQYLADNGFRVKRERAVTENNKVYSVMEVCYTGKTYKASDLWLRIGNVKPETDDDVVYIKRQIALCTEYIENIKKAPFKEKELKAAIKVLNSLKEIIKDGV